MAYRVELRACASWSDGRVTFRKGIPLMVSDEELVNRLRITEKFGIVELEQKKKLKKAVSELPKVEDELKELKTSDEADNHEEEKPKYKKATLKKAKKKTSKKKKKE